MNNPSIQPMESNLAAAGSSSAASQAEASLDAVQRSMDDLGTAMLAGTSGPTTFGSGAAAASRAAKSGRVVHAAASDDLPKMDQALAADIDHLLQGDFESIDAVLEGVFEEKAALIQTDEMPKAAPPSGAATGRFIREPGNAGVPRNATAVELQPPTPKDEPQVAGQAPVAEVRSTEIRENTNQVPNPQVADSPAQAPHTPVTAAAPAAVVIRPRVSLFAKVNQGVLAVLCGLNAPIRILPAKLHKAVNILAITLVLWAPAVWLLAPMFRHDSNAPLVEPGIEDSPDSTDSHDAPPHEPAASHDPH